MTDEHVSVGTAVQISGMHANTIRKYADNNQIQSYKSPSGQRKIHKQSLQRFCMSSSVRPQIPQVGKQSFIYARVSSKKQHDDLARQIAFLQTRKPLYNDYLVVQDIASGINFQRKGLQSILDSCLQGTVGEVVVAHRDRLARFGFELIKYLIEKSGGKITVIDDQQNKSTEQELSEDLLSIVHIYSCKQMGKRSYRAKHESRQNSTENQPSQTTTIPKLVQV